MVRTDPDLLQVTGPATTISSHPDSIERSRSNRQLLGWR